MADKVIDAKTIDEIARKRNPALHLALQTKDRTQLDLATKKYNADVTRMRECLMNDRSGSWRHADPKDFEDACFNGTYTMDAGGYNDLLNTNEGKKEKSNILQTDAMKKVDDVPYKTDNGAGFPLEGKLPWFAWQEMTPEQLNTAMINAGFNPNNQESRKRFISRLTELTDQAKRGALLSDLEDSWYNEALNWGGFSSTNDQAKKQIATGKGTDAQMYGSLALDAAADAASLIPGTATSGAASPIYNAGIELARQGVEGVADVGNESFDAGQILAAGASAATVPTANNALGALVKGRPSGVFHDFKEGFQRGSMGYNPYKDAEDDLVARILDPDAIKTMHDIQEQYTVGKTGYGRNAKKVTWERPQQQYKGYWSQPLPISKKHAPENANDIPLDQVKQGSEFTVISSETPDLDPTDITPIGAYFADLAHDRPGWEDVSQIIHKSYLGRKPLTSKEKQRVRDFVKATKAQDVQADMVVNFTKGGPKDGSNMNDISIRTKKITSEDAIKNKEPESKAYKAGGLLGRGLSDFFGTMEPIVIRSQKDYKEQEWYKKLPRKEKEAIDAAYEKKLNGTLLVDEE